MAADEPPVFVTIATSDYAAQARVFARSARACHPEVRLAVLALGSGSPEAFADAFDIVVAPEELPLACLADMRFRYSIRELCFALKPWVIGHLADEFPGAAVCYFDSDIELFSRLTEVEEMFDGGASVILMPHILAPAVDQEGDEALLRSGTFNGGFIAAAPTPQGRAFIHWWGERLKTGCTIDATCGDQKWLDLVPSAFDEAAILRHPGHNFAFWNAPQRPLRCEGGQWLAAGLPLRFVHYTKWDLREEDWQRYLTAWFRCDWRPFAPLFEAYQTKVRREDRVGRAQPRRVFQEPASPTGKLVPEAVRAAYAKHGPSVDGKAADVFARAVAVLNAPSTSRVDLPLPVSVLYDEIWQHERDLRYSFDIDELSGRLAYLQWVAANGVTRLALPAEFVAPARAALSAAWVQQLTADDTAASGPPANLVNAALNWLPIMTVGDIGERGDDGIRGTVGHSGHLVYGPYVRLAGGEYRLTVRLSAGSPPRHVRRSEAIATIEVVTDNGGVYLLQQPLALEDCAKPEHRLRFRVGKRPPNGPVEVRVWTSGVVPLIVSLITVERLA